MKVHCASVERPERDGVPLSTGEVVDVGTVIYATGREKSPSKLFSTETQ